MVTVEIGAVPRASVAEVRPEGERQNGDGDDETVRIDRREELLDLPRGYRGVNTSWRNRVSGQRFEVQFHTPQSYHAKEYTHPRYEEARHPSTSPERVMELHASMNEIFGKVPIPKGAGEVHGPPPRENIESEDG